jgi:hypothetical protein
LFIYVPFATGYGAFFEFCRNMGLLSHAFEKKTVKKVGMSPKTIVSLHRQSEQTTSERQQKETDKQH